MAEFLKPYTTDELREAVEHSRTYKKDNIYLVNCKVLAKCRGEKYVRHEPKIGRRVYGKANVPEPYGTESFEFKSEITGLSLLTWFSMMQLIEGTRLGDLPEHEQGMAMNKRNVEIAKILNLGIYPLDCFHLTNSLLTPDGSVFLVDFGMWRDGTEEEIGTYRGYLKSGARITGL